MPKRKANADRVTLEVLEQISVLFIPFDAAIQHYKRSAENGVKGVLGTFTVNGRPMDLKDLHDPLLQSDDFINQEKIAKKLNKIVRQECELVRSMHNVEPDDGKSLEDLVKRLDPKVDPNRWSEHTRKWMERDLRGYKHYPTLIFISENPTGVAFPERLDTGVETMGYVKKHSLDEGTFGKKARTNEMAVYLREDIDQRIDNSKGESDKLFLRTEAITRHVKGRRDLHAATKDEFMLKVTIGNTKVSMGKTVGCSFTVAGVHLRAGLTNSNENAQQKERNDLQPFCEREGIQLLVGDFNMDVQRDSRGGRGVFFDNTPKNQPVFRIQSGTGIAFPQFHQQYSNSPNTKHFMGYFQADTIHLRLVGPGMYGLMGASGSRSLGGKYYSDHPSIYVQVESKRQIGVDATTKMRKLNPQGWDDLERDDEDQEFDFTMMKQD